MFTMPSTQGEWKSVARQFRSRWNFDHCCVAIYGKHVAVKKPKKSGSPYYNYKGFFSVMLLALVDANYSFMWCNVGANGSSSDADVFNHSVNPLGGAGREHHWISRTGSNSRRWSGLSLLYRRRRCISAEKLDHEALQSPFHDTQRAGDELSYTSLSSWCRERFGIMAHRCRYLLTTLQLEPGNVIRVVLGYLTLHS